MNERQQLQTYNETFTRAQADAVEAILRSYSKIYRRSDTVTLLITPVLNSDTDLLWNSHRKRKAGVPTSMSSV